MNVKRDIDPADLKYAYSSRDFFDTTNEIKPVEIRRSLIHKDVRGTRNAGNEQFSAERKHPVHVVGVPSDNVSMSIGGILVGGRTRRHRHTYETVVLILAGEGYTIVGGELGEDGFVHGGDRQAWQAGDALLVPRYHWHQHWNTGSVYAEYVGAENAPQLQNLGLAIREEAPNW
jgi:mannose-6-phosphate isomerase-like protein (cupin superfamily)